MANLSESAVYDAGVYQIETTDPVSGGPLGIANKPLINLANRTAYLKSRVDNLESGATVPPTVAPLNSPTFTGDPKAPTPALGDNDTSIATTAFVQATLGGVLSKSVAGGVNVTLTAVEAGNGILIFTGALTASINVIVPATPSRPWIVFNNTSGAFTLTVKTAAGTGIAVTQGRREILYCDGTNVQIAFTDFDSVALTGTPTTPTAAADTNTTQIASTAFVLGQASSVSPLMNGTAAAGTSPRYSRQDHVHPTDTSRAPLASPVFTGDPQAPTAASGDNDTSLATTAFVQAALGGVLSKSVAGGANVTLTAVEAGNGILVFTGALTANIAVIVPTSPTRPWIVRNATSGAFTLTVRTAAGVGVAVTQGRSEIVYGDGTNVVLAKTDFVSPALTGIPTAPTAPQGTITTQIATTDFATQAASDNAVAMAIALG